MKRKFESFISIFEKAMQEYPDKPALIVEEKMRTYREIYEHARKIAGYLQRAGIVQGAPVAIISRNDVDYVETVLGCVMAGAVVVKINWRLAVPELHYLLHFNQVKYIFFRSQDVNIRKEMAAETRELCPAMNMDEMERILESEEPIEQFVPRGDDAELMRLHTSGTTGFPKVVRYGNAQFLEELEACVASLHFDTNTIFQIMSQMFHSASMGVYSCLASGGEIVLFRKFDPESYLESVERNRVTRMSAIPTVLTALLNCPQLEQYDLGSISMISYSTCPMPPELIRRAFEKFHCEFQQSYGMTEMGSIVTMLTPEDHFRDDMRYLNSVGTPISGHRIKILDDQGQECLPGVIGEVCVQGPGMMLDYYQMPDVTREAIVDGWYHTKDMGFLDEMGYLFIRGRKNDMIISGGENIFPQEIENVLQMNPGIMESAVVGISDPYWGEAVHACVILKDGVSMSEQEIRDFCRGRIAGYKIPKKVHICQTFPRTATGKVQKSALIELIAQ